MGKSCFQVCFPELKGNFAIKVKKLQHLSPVNIYNQPWGLFIGLKIVQAV